MPHDPAFEQSFTLWTGATCARQLAAVVASGGVIAASLALSFVIGLLWMAASPGSSDTTGVQVSLAACLVMPFGALIAWFTLIVGGFVLKDPLRLEIEGTTARVYRRSQQIWSGHVSEVKPYGRLGAPFTPTFLEFGPHRLDVGRVPAEVSAALAAFERLEAGDKQEVPAPLREQLERR